MQLLRHDVLPLAVFPLMYLFKPGLKIGLSCKAIKIINIC